MAAGFAQAGVADRASALSTALYCDRSKFPWKSRKMRASMLRSGMYNSAILSARQEWTMPAKKQAPKKRAKVAASRNKAASKKAAARKKPSRKKSKVTKKKKVSAKKPAVRKSSASKKSSKKKAAAKKKPASRKKSPAKKKAASRKKAPVKKKAPSRKKAPAKKKAPSKKKAPAKKKAPSGKKTAAKKQPASKKKTATKKVAKKAAAVSKKSAVSKKKVSAKKAPAKTAASKTKKKSRGDLMSGPIHGVKPYQQERNEDYMNAEQLEHFRDILLSWKRELMNEVDRTLHHMQDEAANFPDPNDRATQESEFGLELRTRDRERKLLRKINSALARIDEGTYGYCEETGEEIGLKRLEARPVATLCLEAQERRELAERQFRDRDDRYR
ncbi:MAG: RNA polymerase-binding protein DksA [Woeseia sp.]